MSMNQSEASLKTEGWLEEAEERYYDESYSAARAAAAIARAWAAVSASAGGAPVSEL